MKTIAFFFVRNYLTRKKRVWQIVTIQQKLVSRGSFYVLTALNLFAKSTHYFTLHAVIFCLPRTNSLWIIPLQSKKIVNMFFIRDLWNSFFDCDEYTYILRQNSSGWLLFCLKIMNKALSFFTRKKLKKYQIYHLDEIVTRLIAQPWIHDGIFIKFRKWHCFRVSKFTCHSNK